MHALHLIHTDLKPENILLVSPENVKVPDFKSTSRPLKGGSYFKRLPKSNAIKVIDFGSTTYECQDQTYIVSHGIIVLQRLFLEKKSVRPTFSAERIFGGTSLTMCSNDFICFYGWAECKLILWIDVTVKNLYWADSDDLVAIANYLSFYILKYNRDVVQSYLDSGAPVDEQGVEDAFELLHETNDRVRTGLWVGDCFIYNNYSWRLNYCVGGEVTTMFHLDRPMYLLGYLASQSRVYMMDKVFNVMGCTLLLSLIAYKTLVMRGDLERANEILPSIPKEHHNSYDTYKNEFLFVLEDIVGHLLLFLLLLQIWLGCRTCFFFFFPFFPPFPLNLNL